MCLCVLCMFSLCYWCWLWCQIETANHRQKRFVICPQSSHTQWTHADRRWSPLKMMTMMIINASVECTCTTHTVLTFCCSQQQQQRNQQQNSSNNKSINVYFNISFDFLRLLLWFALSFCHFTKAKCLKELIHFCCIFFILKKSREKTVKTNLWLKINAMQLLERDWIYTIYEERALVCTVHIWCVQCTKTDADKMLHTRSCTHIHTKRWIRISFIWLFVCRHYHFQLLFTINNQQNAEQFLWTMIGLLATVMWIYYSHTAITIWKTIIHDNIYDERNTPN